MARTTVNKSISFDPELFEKMEQYREKHMMERSEFIVRCVTKVLLNGPDSPMVLEQVPSSLVSHPLSLNSRSGPRKKSKKLGRRK